MKIYMAISQEGDDFNIISLHEERRNAVCALIKYYRTSWLAWQSLFKSIIEQKIFKPSIKEWNTKKKFKEKYSFSIKEYNLEK